MIKQPRTVKSEQRQTQLEDSLLKLLHDKPYPRITVADICITARIPRRTFYHYFDSKDAVLKSLIDNMVHHCSLQVMLNFQSDQDYLKDSLTRNFRYWQGQGRVMMEVLQDNNLEGELVSAGLKWLRAERLNFRFRPELSDKQIEIATTASVASFFAILYCWRKNNYQDTPEEMAEYTAWFLSDRLFHF